MNKAFALPFFAALAACSPGAKNSAEVRDLQEDIATMKGALALQANQISGLQDRLTTLDETASKDIRFATLDPAGGAGYQYISTNVAPVLISFVDSAPVGDGTKVRLKVGNLSSAVFSGVELSVVYNTRIPQDGKGIEAWNSSARSVVARNANDIPAGAWTTVEASLPGIKPQDLGHLAVSAKFDSLSLRRTD
ncbi:DUF3251 domain-containing protein [Xanthomonas campestris]|uniref:DUF3251 domain-containing protein n=1 Tax=Xanthomonas campestris TaxID=339 RepID=UPI002367EA41|nr:DUF3251 domain-containing protein [Xanthomonas campestris]WDI91958.1 DUF3251 domain-containing protein [Xanthomonas campestris]